MKGSKKLGSLCLRGHDYDGSGQSLRYISNGVCVECIRDFNRAAVESGDNKSRWDRRLSDPFAAALHAMQGRKCTKGVPVEVTKNYLKELWEEQNGLCYWLGIPLDLERGDNPLFARGHSLSKATVDRLDPNKGYVEGNIVWASAFANIGRQRAPVEEFQKFLKNLGIYDITT